MAYHNHYVDLRITAASWHGVFPVEIARITGRYTLADYNPPEEGVIGCNLKEVF